MSEIPEKYTSNLNNTIGCYPSTNLVQYIFPLREGFDVSLILPRDITTKEVERLIKLLEAVCNE